MVRMIGCSPFRYYHEMLATVMRSELSYDAVPNFTAADGRRLVGIGRNEFIDAMNKSRSRNWFNKKRYAVKDLLPGEPVEPVRVDYWWHVCLASATLPSDDDIRAIGSPDERHVVLSLARAAHKRAPPMLAGHFDRAALVSLYKRGAVFLDVPIGDDDRITIPPLDQFVMNRLRGDYFERLLYTIFFAITERTTMRELADLLETVDLDSVKQAVSMYCRLGFARKLTLPRFEPTSERWHRSWSAHEQAASDASVAPATAAAASDDGRPRIALVYDEELTAFLMMAIWAPASRRTRSPCLSAARSPRTASPRS
jgi:KaiC/GvpD/RAD55 family RecA-like ATPase